MLFSGESNDKLFSLFFVIVKVSLNQFQFRKIFFHAFAGPNLKKIKPP